MARGERATKASCDSIEQVKLATDHLL